jgi:ribokinase
VVVAGSLNIDRFLNMKRWARPGETVEAESFMMTFGGKGANQAITAGYLNSSGGTTHMLGQVGQDRDGIMMLDVMGQYTRTEGIIKIEDAPTGMAYIMLNEEDRENEIIIVGGANMKYPAANVYFLPVSWVTAIKDAHVVLLQREVPEWVNIAVAACARKAGAMTMLDMGGQDDPLSKELIALCDIISPNEVS